MTHPKADPFSPIFVSQEDSRLGQLDILLIFTFPLGLGHDDASQTVQERPACHPPPEAARLWSSALLDFLCCVGCVAPPLFSSEADSEHSYRYVVSYPSCNGHYQF